MALKYELTEAPNESVAALYKQVGDKFVLDVEGVVPEAKFKETETKLGEFRNNNVTLKQQLEVATKTSLKDKDPSQINVEQILEKHVAEMKTNYEAQVTTLADQNKALNVHLERVVLSDSVREAAIKYGVQESALPDVLNRARDVFTVKDGVATAKEAKVDKAGKPYGVVSWIETLVDSAPHLFAPSRGSGSQKPVKGYQPQSNVTGVDRIAQGLAALTK